VVKFNITETVALYFSL